MAASASEFEDHLLFEYLNNPPSLETASIAAIISFTARDAPSYNLVIRFANELPESHLVDAKRIEAKLTALVLSQAVNSPLGCITS